MSAGPAFPQCLNWERPLLKAPAGTPPWGVELVRQIEAEFLNRAQLPVGTPTYFSSALILMH